ncbi:hypothetical protein Tcan_06543 [Toxocara canis]|nr:hypothetical protein Tcan_06543 [Toxocara canis]
MLIWRRPPDIDDWSKVKPAVLLLVGEYGDDDKPESKRRIIQRMNGQVSPDKECDPANPPEEKFSFGSAAAPEKGAEAAEVEQPSHPQRKEEAIVSQPAQQGPNEQNTVVIMAVAIFILTICILLALAARGSGQK